MKKNITTEVIRVYNTSYSPLPNVFFWLVNKKLIYLQFNQEIEIMIKSDTNSSKILTMTKGERPIVYKPIYVDITGSKNSAILLYQILFWCDWVNGEFYKSDKEFAQMIGLSFDEFRIAKKKLKDLGFIKAIKRGFPPKTYYSIGEQEFLKIREALIIQNSYLDQPVDNSPPFCVNSTHHSAGIPQNGHYIQRSIKENPSIGFLKDTSADDTIQSIGGGDGLNQIREEEKVLNQTVDESVDNFNKITYDSELDRQTMEFINIFPDISKKPGFKLVREALRIALTKKSFAGLCEHARDFVSVQRRQRSDEYITCAHTWLNHEKWPKFSSLGNPNATNPYAEKVKEESSRLENEKQLRVSIEKALNRKIGDEEYNRYFHWKVCSISLKSDPIVFMFDSDIIRKEAETKFATVIHGIIRELGAMDMRTISFAAKEQKVTKNIFEGFSSRGILAQIRGNNLRRAA